MRTANGIKGVVINVDEYEALAIPGGFGEFGFYEEAYEKIFLTLI